MSCCSSDQGIIQCTKTFHSPGGAKTQYWLNPIFAFSFFKISTPALDQVLYLSRWRVQVYIGLDMIPNKLNMLGKYLCRGLSNTPLSGIPSVEWSVLYTFYFDLLLCKILQSRVLTQVFGDVCVCLWFFLSFCVCNNFLVYSITKTILPESSPHFVEPSICSYRCFYCFWTHLEKQHDRHICLLHCREYLQPFQPIYYYTKTDIHFNAFWRWPPFSIWLPWDNFLCFSISFSRLTFSWTEKKQHRYRSFWIYISEYWHEIWDVYYAFALFVACWPQIVNFISPNYAQSSVSSLAGWLPWAFFLCFSISFSSLTVFFPNFAKYALGPMSECSCNYI